MFEMMLGSCWIDPMKRKIRLQTRQKFFIHKPVQNIEFKVILAFIICEILHPMTVQ